ncbi:phosphatase PAP2 family protein [Novilysobacter antarcticus]|uniref:phosphatase PAP2 family protein n=1 Tax=Novilysobacter antarcticus TaxID=2862543 RepID=UPI0031BAD239
MVLISAHGDFLLADLLYAAQGNAWALRDSWITTTLVHEAGKAVSAAAWLGVLIAWLWSLVDSRLTHWRRPLGYLVFATLAGSVAVSLLKAGSGMDCPWDLQRYGGLQPFVGLFESRPQSMGHAACFPAGHASAGYAWVTLYFFFHAVQPRLRWAGLALALAAGALFGISQQLRGAHFLSHDVWTLMICWLVALAGSLWILRPYGPGAPA